MADTPATIYSDIMTKLIGNTGGGIAALPEVTLLGGRVRQQVSRFAVMAGWASGIVIAVARIPLFAGIRSIDVMTDTSLGSSTLAFGNAHDTQGAIYGAAATQTATNTLARKGPPAATFMVPITTGYDYLGNLTSNPRLGGVAGGFGYEDVLMTIGAATMPSTGILSITVEYVID